MTLSRSFKVLFFMLLICSCGPRETFVELFGEAQGTTYSIKYRNPATDEIPEQVDSVFRRMDALFSTYLPASDISKFNAHPRGYTVTDEFKEIWECCWEVNINTGGLFDPTLAPVLDLYKVRGKDASFPDSAAILAALSFTGLQLLELRGDSALKKAPGVRLDLNGIAQGYTVDVLANLLETHHVNDYLVEVGGEVRCQGKNKMGETWTIGIDKPVTSGKRMLMCRMQLDNRSMATSGNYRKFVEINGRKIGHIIDPRTGFPAETELLSVSVFSSVCVRADAYATAFMNMRESEVVDLVTRDEDLDVVIISLVNGDTTVYASPGIAGNLLK